MLWNTLYLQTCRQSLLRLPYLVNIEYILHFLWWLHMTHRFLVLSNIEVLLRLLLTLVLYKSLYRILFLNPTPLPWWPLLIFLSPDAWQVRPIFLVYFFLLDKFLINLFLLQKIRFYIWTILLHNTHAWWYSTFIQIILIALLIFIYFSISL